MGELALAESVVMSTARELHVAVDETESGLATLDAQLADLLGAGWTGRAGAAFGDIWQRWHDGADQMIRGLQTMATLLERAAHNYHQTDAEGGSTIDAAGM